jgi:hypothetical protein
MLAAASHDCHPAVSQVTPAVLDDAGFLLEAPKLLHLLVNSLSEIHADR